ncbi:hypothetical protein [Shewanella baltica]|uniref:hypothetical protein n=1 Tax=Shewanella baltica TaxID=62322 RepID=UPI00325D7D00
MKKLVDFIGKASKISGNGYVYYELWFNTEGAAYVRLTENLPDFSEVKAGTHSMHLYSLAVYAPTRFLNHALGELEAYDLVEKKNVVVKDNNNGGFLKAALRDLLPKQAN